ncbi:MAG TPA: hypothetical protein VHB73_06990, partial [Alphaproteobacteria bacterium]|nr:hypothetical protein [Alphaproteobacteria bacterium]
ELKPSDKKIVPVQAADVLCWHTQRLFASRQNPSIIFSDVDSRRYAKLTRFGVGHTWEQEMIKALCGTLFEDWRKLNEAEEVREIQSNNEHDPSGRFKDGESCDGGGEED